MTKQIQDMIAHVRKIRAEADNVITELERMAEEAVGGKAPAVPHSKARGPQFVESARIIIRQKGACRGAGVNINCIDCPFGAGIYAICWNFKSDLSYQEDPTAVESARQYLRDCGEVE